MHRSDRIYLSKFALDPDPEYLDSVDFDLDDVTGNDEFFGKIAPQDSQKMSTAPWRQASNEN